MLRDIKYGTGKPVYADFKAATAMATGMAVILNQADKTAKFPTAATADELFFVDKERIPTGINTAKTDMSDYDDNFIKIAKDEFVKLKKYAVGEEFATDAVTAGATKGKVLVAGTDGKLKDATTTEKSRYQYIDTYTDNGRTLAWIRVLETPIANA